MVTFNDPKPLDHRVFEVQLLHAGWYHQTAMDDMMKVMLRSLMGKSFHPERLAAALPTISIYWNCIETIDPHVDDEGEFHDEINELYILGDDRPRIRMEGNTKLQIVVEEDRGGVSELKGVRHVTRGSYTPSLSEAARMMVGKG